MTALVRLVGAWGLVLFVLSCWMYFSHFYTPTIENPFGLFLFLSSFLTLIPAFGLLPVRFPPNWAAYFWLLMSIIICCSGTFLLNGFYQ